MALMTQIILDYHTRLDLNYLRNPRNLRMKNQEVVFCTPSPVLFLVQQDFIDGASESSLVGGTHDDLWLSVCRDEDNGG